MFIPFENLLQDAIHQTEGQRQILVGYIECLNAFHDAAVKLDDYHRLYGIMLPLPMTRSLLGQLDDDSETQGEDEEHGVESTPVRSNDHSILLSSKLDIYYQIIQNHGRPMHANAITDIAQHMGMKWRGKMAPATLVRNLMNTSHRFTNRGSNIWDIVLEDADFNDANQEVQDGR